MESVVNFTAENLDLSYVSEFYNQSDSEELYQELYNYDFESITFNIGGREFTPNRKVLAYSDSGLSYSFCGTTLNGLPWTEKLLKLKGDVEKFTKTQFNFVLLNYYPDGFSKISPHCDNESTMEAQSPIVTLSLGATRKIIFSRKDYASQNIDLESGSLMVMHPPTNRFWKHSIPLQPDVSCGRISVTFRSLSPTQAPSRKRKLEGPRRIHVAPLENDPKNRVVWEKDVCLGAQLKVNHTRNGLYVEMCPIVGAQYDYSTAVFINSATWMEFESKFSDFNFRYKDSSFMCADNLIVCWRGDTCVIQQLAWSFPGYKTRPICVELNQDEVAMFRELIPEVTQFLLQKLFSISIPHFVNEYKNMYKPEGVPLPINENEEIFWNCISQAISNSCDAHYKCEGCKISDPSQLHHSCLFLTAVEKFALLGQNVLLELKIFDLCREICTNVNIEHLAENFFDTVTLEKCIDMFENCSKTHDIF